MKETKRQHTVPQSYLARFSRDGDRLFAFDKTTRKSFFTSTKNVTQERYFYDMPDDIVMEAFPERDCDLQFVEKALSQAEGRAKQLLDEILKTVKGRGVITREQRLCLAPHIVLQWLRTRLSRDLILEMK